MTTAREDWQHSNVLEAEQLSDRELVQTYVEQHGVERGFAFLRH